MAVRPARGNVVVECCWGHRLTWESRLWPCARCGAVLLLRSVAVRPVLDGLHLVAAEHALRPEDVVESAVAVTTTNVDALTQEVKVLFV